MSEFIRARSDAQKAERMADIMAAAQSLFDVQPYATITMSCIAEKLGWTRTKLYKYAATREEIFLALCAQQRDAYFADALTALPKAAACSGDALARAWAKVLSNHRDYLRYSGILLTIIETNVDVDRLAAFKQVYYREADCFEQLLAEKLHITPETVQAFSQAVTFHACGLCSRCADNPLVRQALKKIGHTPAKVDFCKEMQCFILMCYQHYCG